MSKKKVNGNKFARHLRVALDWIAPEGDAPQALAQAQERNLLNVSYIVAAHG